MKSGKAAEIAKPHRGILRKFFSFPDGKARAGKSSLLKENVQLREKIAALEKGISDAVFLHNYNDKMLNFIIRNNENFIARYLAMVSENTSEIKSSLDEFKSNLSNMNAGLLQMTRTVTDLATSASKQSDFSNRIVEYIRMVEKNNDLSFSDSQTLNSSIRDLFENSTMLKDLVQNVEDIAEKLRYLSFNGRIQAAFLEHMEHQINSVNQGEGAGFTVIASQMESLSGGVSDLINKENSSTNKIIGSIVKSVELSKKVEGLQLTNLASLKEVTSLITSLNDELGTVAAGSEELSATAEEFSSSIEELYATIESISSMADSFYDTLLSEVGLYQKTKRIGGEVRNIADRSATLHEAAQRMMQLVREEFIDSDTGKSSFVMARLFVSLPFRSLPEEYQEKYLKPGVGPETIYLCLMGTGGDHPDWNNIRLSKGHQAILLPQNEEDLRIMPMLAHNFKKLGISYDEIVRPRSGQERPTVEGYSLEKNAAGSPYIPDQDFVKNYGIQSQLGIGGVFPSGNIFTAFLFSTRPLTESFAESFMTLAVALQMALKQFDINGNYW